MDTENDRKLATYRFVSFPAEEMKKLVGKEVHFCYHPYDKSEYSDFGTYTTHYSRSGCHIYITSTEKDNDIGYACKMDFNQGCTLYKDNSSNPADKNYNNYTERSHSVKGTLNSISYIQERGYVNWIDTLPSFFSIIYTMNINVGNDHFKMETTVPWYKYSNFEEAKKYLLLYTSRTSRGNSSSLDASDI